MIAGLCVVECVGFLITGTKLSCYDLGLSLLSGLAFSFFFAVFIGLVITFYKQWQTHAPKVTPLVVAMCLLFVTIVLWLKSSVFERESGLYMYLSFVGLFFLFAAAGRFLWIYLNRGELSLVEAGFKSIIIVSVICLGIHSTLTNTDQSNGFKAVAVIIIIFLFFILQYFSIRIIWSRKKEDLQKIGRIAVFLIMIVFPLLTAIGAGFEYRKYNNSTTAPYDAAPVILITIDTLRYDFLSANNDKASPTPAMDSLAKDGVSFQYAIAPAPWTLPSLASIMTGLNVSACGAGKIIPVDGYNFTGPAKNAETIASVFQDEGYMTSAFVKNTWLSPSHGLGKGFVKYHFPEKDDESEQKFLLSRVSAIVERKLQKKTWKGRGQVNT